MRNKKVLGISIVAIITLVCITVGVSVAFFNYAKLGTTDNTLETGSITFLYTETSNAGRGIAIEDAFPITDTEGKALTGEGNVFDFNISSTKSGHNKRIDYEITARKSDDSTLDEDVVVMYLTKVDGVNEREILLDKYSNLTNTEKVSGYNEKTLYSTAVYVADDIYSQDYRLRMWITNDGTFAQEDMGKTFKVNVNVYADAKVVEQGQIAFENNTLIDNLKVGNSTINPVENEEYEYNTVLPYDTHEANIVIETENPKATIDIKNVTGEYAYTNIIQKMSTTRKLEGLVNGDNYFDITITSENGKVEDEYILKVEVKDITPPELEITSVEKTINSLVIKYNTSDNDSRVKNVRVEYGTSNTYGESATCTNGECNITGLGLGTEYYYKVISINISDYEKVIESKTTTSLCEAGYYGEKGTSSCSKCPTGYTSDNGALNVNSCYLSLEKGQGKSETGLATTCSSGTYKSDEVSKAYYGTSYSCSTCEAGYFCTGGSAKTACSTLGTGYTSDEGATANTSCYINLKAGEYKTAEGVATTCGAGTYSGTARKGYYKTAYSCSTCEAGYFCTGGSAKTACSSLGTGYTSSAGATANTSCYINLKAGEYKTAEGVATTCGAGTYNDTARTAYYGTGYSCTACPAGSYCTGGSAKAACSSLGTGYTSSAGATANTKCYINLAAGQGKTTTGTATSCAAGTYYGSARTGYYGTAYNCTTCEAGYYCTGGSARSACSGLGSGYTSAAGAKANTSCYVSLAAGQYKTANGTAASCGAGTYYGSARTAYYGTAYNCSTCSSGYYTNTGNNAGATTCTICPTGSSCNGKTASTCAAGTYTNGTGKSSCTTCEAGYYCTGGSARSACSGLGSGYTSAAGAKANTSCYISLKAGQSKTTTGTAASCGAGTYYGSARTAYYGTAYNCSTCPAGQYNSTTGNTGCTKCEAGYYCTGGSNHTSCGSGKSSAAGSTSSSACYSLCSYAVGKTWDYNYTGGMQSFTVPTGCSGTYKLEVYGAQGGGSSGGKGGYSYGNISVTAGTVLYIGVGQQGKSQNGSADGTTGTAYNGGGYGKTSIDVSYWGTGGGGATHIGKTNAILSSTTSSNLYIVAGGGGGCIHNSNGSYVAGGTGGGTNGGNAANGGYLPGYGGTQSAGGTGAQTGSYGTGGSYTSSYTYEGAGGGGGYYGGASGRAGGGGSGYIGGVTGGSMSNGQRSGNGFARITLVSVN